MPRSTASETESTQYILTVLKHTEFKPDYHGVAEELSITSANNAQKKFRKLVKDAGFDLVNGQVVAKGTTPTTPATTPATPKKQRSCPSRKTTGEITASSKKRKMEEVSAEEEEDAAVGRGLKDEEK